MEGHYDFGEETYLKPTQDMRQLRCAVCNVVMKPLS